MSKLKLSRTQGSGISFCGLPQHQGRVVQSGDRPVLQFCIYKSERDARPAAKLKHPIGRLKIEQAHGPAIALDVRASMGHDPAGHVTEGAARPAELGDHGGAECHKPEDVVSLPCYTRLTTATTAISASSSATPSTKRTSGKSGAKA